MELAKIASSILCGYRKCRTHARLLSTTHGMGTARIILEKETDETDQQTEEGGK